MPTLLGTSRAVLVTILVLIPPALGQEARRPPAINFLVSSDTGVFLKRSGWTKSAPAFFGSVVALGDQLFAESKTAKAVIACADLSVRTVTDFPSGVPCEMTGPVLLYKDSRLAPARDTGAGTLTILSPRKTVVLSPHPLIRWSPISDVVAYRVTVRGPDLSWSSDVRGKTDLIYASTAPALLPNVPYKVTVSGGGHSSDEDKTPNLGFTVLSRGDAQKVSSSENKIRSLNLAQNASQLLVAVLYASNDLRADAIEALESLRASNEPVFLRQLADLLVGVERARDAVEVYQKAAEISAKRGDLEGEAIANGQLGKIYGFTLGDGSKGAAYLDRATAIYQSLGDERNVSQLREQKKSLEKI